MKRISLLIIISIFIKSVFDDPEENLVSVMEGDSVTLHTDVTDMKGVMKVIWRFGEEASQSFLVGLHVKDGTVDHFDTDERFRDKLQVNNQTGDLIIKNMRTKHTGRYQAEIINDNRGTTYKNYRVTVYAPQVSKAVAVQCDVMLVLMLVINVATTSLV